MNDTVYLYWDTETTGKWDYSKDINDPDQPKIVQIGARLATRTEVLADIDLLIEPKGWDIPEGAQAVHHISTEKAKSFGVSMENALYTFRDLVASCDIIVAHNIEYDRNVTQNNMNLFGVEPVPWKSIPQQCTMLASTPVCKMPPFRRGAWKWPKLDEAHKYFFGIGMPSSAHNAMVDVQGCQRVHLHLLDMGAFN